MVPIGEFGYNPICLIHAGTPSPIPGTKRPGNALAVVVTSIANNAGCLTTAETIPRPTTIFSVLANAIFAPAIPPVKNMSSAIHSSPKPTLSALRASDEMLSGGIALPKSNPTLLLKN